MQTNKILANRMTLFWSSKKIKISRWQRWTTKTKVWLLIVWRRRGLVTTVTESVYTRVRVPTEVRAQARRQCQADVMLGRRGVGRQLFKRACIAPCRSCRSRHREVCPWISCQHAWGLYK